MIKAIIFDFDGVLVESVDIKTKAFARLFEKEGKGIVKKIVDHHTGHSGVSRYEKFKHIYKNILMRPLDDKTFKSLCDRFSSLVVDEVVKAPFVRGAKEFLERGKGRYDLFLSSATPREEIEEIVKRREMARYFTEIHGAPEKKDEIAAGIMQRHGYSPEEVVYVGDAASDYEAARANGVNFIARIKGDAAIFRGLDCVKLKDLVKIEEALGIKSDKL